MSRGVQPPTDEERMATLATLGAAEEKEIRAIMAAVPGVTYGKAAAMWIQHERNTVATTRVLKTQLLVDMHRDYPTRGVTPAHADAMLRKNGWDMIRVDAIIKGLL